MTLRLENFSPIQRRMISVLDDGGLHDLEELVACLEDTEASSRNVHPHLSAIRKVLRPWGIDIIPQGVKRSLKYRMIGVRSRIFTPDPSLSGPIEAP